jgi:hypothetical protein
VPRVLNRAPRSAPGEGRRIPRRFARAARVRAVSDFAQIVVAVDCPADRAVERGPAAIALLVDRGVVEPEITDWVLSSTGGDQVRLAEVDEFGQFGHEAKWELLRSRNPEPTLIEEDARAGRFGGSQPTPERDRERAALYSRLAEVLGPTSQARDTLGASTSALTAAMKHRTGEGPNLWLTDRRPRCMITACPSRLSFGMSPARRPRLEVPAHSRSWLTGRWTAAA